MPVVAEDGLVPAEGAGPGRARKGPTQPCGLRCHWVRERPVPFWSGAITSYAAARMSSIWPAGDAVSRATTGNGRPGRVFGAQRSPPWPWWITRPVSAVPKGLSQNRPDAGSAVRPCAGRPMEAAVVPGACDPARRVPFSSAAAGSRAGPLAVASAGTVSIAGWLVSAAAGKSGAECVTALSSPSPAASGCGLCCRRSSAVMAWRISRCRPRMVRCSRMISGSGTFGTST